MEPFKQFTLYKHNGWTKTSNNTPLIMANLKKTMIVDVATLPVAASNVSNSDKK